MCSNGSSDKTGKDLRYFKYRATYAIIWKTMYNRERLVLPLIEEVCKTSLHTCTFHNEKIHLSNNTF